MKKQKILELTNYSAGICGVWARVKEEAVRLAKRGHEVRVFSSYFIKGTNDIAKENDKIDGIIIKRFPARKLGGESFMLWNFENEAIKFKPDIIIAHAYRHLHTTKALKLAKKINARVFLVTHAPFIEENRTRTFFGKFFVWFYDKFLGFKLKRFDKIIAITNWEVFCLKKLGVSSSKIEYIPNGIPEQFFIQKKKREENKILFLGRISPIKDIETLIDAINLLKDKKIKLEIVGPAEKDYMDILERKVKKNNLGDRIKFTAPIYDIKEKIKKIDSARIFVLPSKSEAMPQSLIEAMAREKIAVASGNKGSKEIIQDGKNGFLFEIGNAAELAEKIKFALKNENQKIRKNAKNSVEQFNWKKVIEKLDKLIRG